MSEKEIRLIEMIRNNNDPKQALLTAVEIIAEHLNLLASSESTLSVDYRECS